MLTILMVILQILTGCGKKVDVCEKQQKITDTDGKDVSKDIIEKIKNNYADKNIEDLIFIPIKPGQCVIWNNQMYKHLVFANKTRLMMGPMDLDFKEVGFILRGGADELSAAGGAIWDKKWNSYELDNKSYTVPIRYATQCHTGMHHDTYPESSLQNDISIVVYLNDADGYFILQKDNKSVQDNFKVIDLSIDHKDYITQLYNELNTDIKKYVDVDDDACVASDYDVEGKELWKSDFVGLDFWLSIEDNNTESIIKVTVENKKSGNKYVLKDNKGDTINNLVLFKGSTYKFDLSDPSVASHPFLLSTTEDGIHNEGLEYTSGIFFSGNTPGIATELKFTVPYNAPDTMYYYCSKHRGMADDKTITIKSEWKPRPGNNWVILKKIESKFISSLYKNIGNYLEEFGIGDSFQWTRVLRD